MNTAPFLDRQQAESWAWETFGHAELGNTLRMRRLVKMAASAAQNPSGVVSKVFTNGADAEGAFRFLESKHVDARQISRAAYRATARRAASESFVFVPVDGSNLTLSWAHGTDAFGPVGTMGQKVRGIEVMNAVAVSPSGTPLGLSGQQWWIRKEYDRSKPESYKPRPLHEKETRYWFKAIEQTEAAFREEGVLTKRWYQLDAGADFREMLQWMASTDQWATVRVAQQNRRLQDDETSDPPERRYLCETAAQAPLLGTYSLNVLGSAKRKKRTACIEVRSERVVIRLYDPWSKCIEHLELTAVLAREVGTCPPGEDPIDWLLLTNRPVETYEDAKLVIDGYSRRWRVETFHRTWKDTCSVEKTQLRDDATIIPWATILACVAMRIERLTHLAREEPETPAAQEFTQNEIDAVVLLRKPTNPPPSINLTLAEVVRWVADLGGYRGKSSGGPPGAIVIARGLQKVEIAAEVLSKLRSDPLEKGDQR